MALKRICAVAAMLLALLTCGDAAWAATSSASSEPVFSPPGGVYSATQTVKITTATPNAAIYYTTDGAEPTEKSARYSGAIAVSSSMTVKAIAFFNGNVKSAIGKASYLLLQDVLAKLNESAKSFRNATADFEFDTNQTEPVPDTDVLKGVAYYERRGTNFQMAAHIATENGQQAPKTYTFTRGVLKLDEPGVDQVTTIREASKFTDYIMLGFGASGEELASKWDITYDGPESVNGIPTEKLDLVAKDPTVKKNFPKVTIWMDTARAVSVKQVFDQGQGKSRVNTYSNIKVNQSLPKDAFTFKTDSKTQYVNR
jgi:outer membrane lipoprotein-sorting protein